VKVTRAVRSPGLPVSTGPAPRRPVHASPSAGVMPAERRPTASDPEVGTATALPRAMSSVVPAGAPGMVRVIGLSFTDSAVRDAASRYPAVEFDRTDTDTAPDADSLTRRVPRSSPAGPLTVKSGRTETWATVPIEVAAQTPSADAATAAVARPTRRRFTAAPWPGGRSPTGCWRCPGRPGRRASGRAGRPPSRHRGPSPV